MMSILGVIVITMIGMIASYYLLMWLLWKGLTKNRTEIPLLFVFFDNKYYTKNGKIGSCKISLHPLLQKDETIQKDMNKIVDHIRNKYDIDKM